MTDKQQSDALELASVAESADLVGYPTAKKANAYCLCLLEDCAQMIRRLHAENGSLLTERERNLDSIRVNNEIINKKNAELETLRAKLKTHEAQLYTAPQPSPVAQGDALDAERLDWLTFNLSGKALRDIGVVWSEHGDARRAIDAARTAQEGASHEQAPAQAASSAVLKAIREANMQLVRTGDDAFMLVPYKAVTAQAAESVPAGPRRKDMLWSTAKMQERHDQRTENIVSGLERIKQEHAGQQPQKIDECYGDCPTDSTTCTNPCRFDGRAARAPADSVLEDAALFTHSSGIKGGQHGTE